MELLLIGAVVIAGLYFSQHRRRQKTAVWFDGALLRPEDLAAHGRELAKFHRVRTGSSHLGGLLQRLRANYRYISKIHAETAADLVQERQIAPAGEWLLDNFYIIEEQVKDILLTLRQGRFRDLPVLSNGAMQGNPRVYALAIEIIAHTDGSISEQGLTKFIEAYQQEAPLTISEIWSLALMLRIALVEKIRHICSLLAATHKEWRQAESFLVKTSPEKVTERLSAGNKLRPAFAEHLLEVIRRTGCSGKAVRATLTEKLLEQDLSLEKLIHSEHQRKAAQTTSLGNAVLSLKGAANLDWDEIFEQLSLVERILRQDEVYANQDPESRNYYRRQVQILAKKLGAGETRLAKLALANAQAAAEGYKSHSGYYLLDEGRQALFAKAGRPWRRLKLTGGAYIGLLTALTLALAAAIFQAGLPYGAGWAVALALSYLIPGSEIAVSLVNRVLARLKQPTFLPRLEYRQGIPAEAATLVVIPALLPDPQRTRELLASLEVHYLANPDANLFFALLGDFRDSAQAETGGEGAILAAAEEQIAKLNVKYGPDRFFALVRKRRYSKSQQKWMGWERKRGALMELNALLMGEPTPSFLLRPASLPQVSYVLTLDADSRLPLMMAKKLVGAISHPLNKLESDGKLRGYGLIQPRIGASIESVGSTRFAWVMGGPGGADTYTTAVSDVYQDWFGQGIFTGKGIYALAPAHERLQAIPENSILSHDLLEGGLLRTGLATDLELVDDFPARYSSYTAREHRWVRGDWQLLPWLRSRTAGRPNPLNLISRWQIFDNLRRSLAPIFQLLFFGAGLLAPGRIGLWLFAFAASIVLPASFALFDYNWQSYFRDRFSNCSSLHRDGLRRWFERLAWQLTFLPRQLWLNGDAILRTLYRLLISRRNLLEWTTAAEAEQGKADSRRQFRPAIATALLFLLPLAMLRPMNIPFYLPLLGLWLYAPVLADRVSRQPKTGIELPAAEQDLLIGLAQKTWRYYEELVTAKTNYLPPDNYQENPPIGTDSRTSPTNIGFYLLSTLAARDLGFISTLAMVERLEQSLSVINGLEKWNGHLYNWYGIKEVKLLRPRFVSTVDSGNFVCLLVALAQGLKEYPQRPLFDSASVRGLGAAIELPLPTELALADWENILARPLTLPDCWGQRLLAEYREELALLLPQTEIFVAPPKFLAQEPKFRQLFSLCQRASADCSLHNLARCYREILTEIAALADKAAPWQEYLAIWRDDICRAAAGVDQLSKRLAGLASAAEELIANTDFAALYNSKRNLLAVGYSVDEEKLTDSNYDLLASEARLTSFWAIVQHQVPVKHWRQLGRALVRVKGAKALVSWSGTMFEYLMPSLLMENYRNSFLAETLSAVIQVQRRYGEELGLPWGISESGYYAFDYRLNYQYRAFGIPSLGLKRGLVDELVVSPYSTLLALPFAPRAALANIRRFQAEGLSGQYGLFEAVDYSPGRSAGQQDGAVVESYFAHHQGMSLIALANFLGDFAMVRRFHADPRTRAGELLLQETASRQPVLRKQAKQAPTQRPSQEREEREIVRSFGLPSASPPNCHLLSNGSYTVLLTDSGSGFSRNEQTQISRWREIPSDNYGTFIFIKSLNSDQVWSATVAPLATKADFYRVRFFPDRVSYFREMASIDTRTEIVVSTEDNAEIRRVVLTNHGLKEASLEITSFLELALANQDADLAHPAFGNLFVQTEAVDEYAGLLAVRRPRREDEPQLYAWHQLLLEGVGVGNLQYETDRGKFIGRGRDITCPVALHQPLSNSTGSVLDPAFSLRRQIKLGAGQSATLVFVTAQGSSRREMLDLGSKYTDLGACQRAFTMAQTRSLVERRFLNLSPALVVAAQQALGHLIFASPTRRRWADAIASNSLNQQSLWAQGISGDNPIVLVTVDDGDQGQIVREAILAHEYWRFKGLVVDLVVLHGGEGGYHEPVRDLVREMVERLRTGDFLDRPGGIFIRGARQLSSAERYLLQAAARLTLGPGSLSEQLQIEAPRRLKQKEFSGSDWNSGPVLEEPADLLFYNGFGGFNPKDDEYVIWLEQQMTPAPWLNVLANPGFGCTVSERGGGFVFAENSRENKLTPWSNDPVSDPPGEAIYLRDEDSGRVWTVTAAPILEPEPYLIKHGLGYTEFSHHSHGLRQQLTVFVPLTDPVKISLLALRNDSPVRRRLTATYFLRPVLGVSEQSSHLHIVSSFSENLLCFTNAYNGDFPGRVAWMTASAPVVSYSGDCLEFVGSGGLAQPDALGRERLSNTVGAGLAPCGAIQVALTIEPGQQQQLVLQFGQAKNADEIREIVDRSSGQAAQALAATRSYWRSLVKTVEVKTPEISLDVLLSWSLYQSLVCRLWARTGFYQCGGAYGFRDQLQDAANFSLAAPQLAREQILLHAAHQFREGDVQHWWHPGTRNRGVRTRFSDDLLWLPWSVIDYIERTGDSTILAEAVPYLEGEPLEPGVDEFYGEAETSVEIGSVYEHCLRSIELSLRFGERGLPLMGSGDWNDGMSSVGNKGQGESVWLGWFLYTILQGFAPLCRRQSEPERGERYLEQAEAIRRAIEENAWDGRWYRRAYFDDGAPLGAAENSECAIDSLPQSWAAITGGGRRDRTLEAMGEVETHLVRAAEGMILLFAPPFDAGDLKPGYIKGYVPGVRENGGQYTHAACWVVQAAARLGDGDKAFAWLQLLNPINHSRTLTESLRYKVEPYVLAADVYSAASQVGRGGWTWYTGAAGWLYRVCVEDILGLKRRGEKLLIDPCIPKKWREYTIAFSYGASLYSIKITNPQAVNRGVESISVNGVRCREITLVDTGRPTLVEVVMGDEKLTE